MIENTRMPKLLCLALNIVVVVAMLVGGACTSEYDIKPIINTFSKGR
ncbi:MAG: hypothetical protein PVH37_08120 [Desulfobacterales bacterium]